MTKEIILLVVGILYIIETKAIYSIIKYIIIIITLSLYLYDINLNYFCYILIIIYLSALAILFAFVIMLYSQSSTLNKRLSFFSTEFYFLFILAISFFLYIKYNNIEIFERLDNVQELIPEGSLLKKIGVIIYNNNLIIFNFLCVTFILFLALIGVLLLFS